MRFFPQLLDTGVASTLASVRHLWQPRRTNCTRREYHRWTSLMSRAREILGPNCSHSNRTSIACAQTQEGLRFRHDMPFAAMTRSGAAGTLVKVGMPQSAQSTTRRHETAEIQRGNNNCHLVRCNLRRRSLLPCVRTIGGSV